MTRPFEGIRIIDITHVLALAGAFALEQGAGQREGAHRAGRVIDRRRANLDRVDLLGAG